mgnify:CR=1 FL=1|tara:strand:- start:5607 stop:6446 length:840 start_codon:yes stop_codon:yes gene_type:complete
MGTGSESIQKITKKWYADLRKWLVLDTRDIKFKIDWDKRINKTYILNLEHRADRRHGLKEKLKQIKILNGDLTSKITWWKGFYKETKWDSNIHVAEYSFLYHWLIDSNPRWNHIDREQMETVKIDCSIPESNIALGHASILNDIVKNKTNTSLILEDDIEFIPGFTQKLDDIFKEQLPSDWDILYLSALPSRHGFKWEEYSTDLLKVNNGVWWFSGLIVSKRAAKKLIAAFPIVGPVDVWINYQFKDLNVYMTKGNLINQNQHFESDNAYSFDTKYGWN